MQGIIDLVQKLGARRLAAMGAVTLTLIGFFAYVLLRVSAVPMGTLFTDLSPTESASIVRELEARGIKPEVRGEGAVILVPREQVARARMDLAAKGIPAGGSVGYEIFDKGDAFSATGFVQNLNHLRALEGELARSIRAIDRVQSARVHLSIPERRLFQKDKVEPRASVVLKVRGELDASQVRAIRHLVATAVEGLKPTRISLIDETGTLLADGTGDDGDQATLAADRQASHERRLKTQVEEIVASVVGRGRARVQVAAELDFNRIQQTAETFDPESRVVRSTQTRTEANSTAEGKDGQVGVAGELPGGQKNDSAAGTREQGQKNEEVINYEISRTTRTETIEGGRLKRLSVAVLVDGTYAPQPNGGQTYTPRSAEDLQRIATLVRMGIGFDKTRGDQVEVVNLRFAEAPPLPLTEPTMTFFEKVLAFGRDDLLRFAELAVFALVTLIVLIFVVRPLLREMMSPEVAGPVLAAAASAPTAPNEAATATATSTATADSAPALERLGSRIASQPQDAAAILRSWMRNAA
ncbi:MAG: flagellar M-ring protein FliF [Proteobacteria bacterium]|nr:flagellar M-ring protein FliF [Pseudomonadota bacterium]